MAPLLFARRVDPPPVEVRREMMNSPTMLGAIEIGIFVSMFLFGAIVTEGCSYFRQYGKKDPRMLKVLVSLSYYLTSFGHQTHSLYQIWFLLYVIPLCYLCGV
jgi:hypothetical protein